MLKLRERKSSEKRSIKDSREISIQQDKVYLLIKRVNMNFKMWFLIKRRKLTDIENSDDYFPDDRENENSIEFIFQCNEHKQHFDNDFKESFSGFDNFILCLSKYIGNTMEK